MRILTGHELLAYERAKEAVQEAGVSIDAAAIQYAQAVRLLAQTTVLEAAQAHAARQQQAVIQPKRVSEVVKDLLAYKEQNGRSALHLRDLRLRLERVSAAFRGPLANVTPSEVDSFLRSLKVSPRTQNNYRATIGMLFRFGQQRGYMATGPHRLPNRRVPMPAPGFIGEEGMSATSRTDRVGRSVGSSGLSRSWSGWGTERRLFQWAQVSPLHWPVRAAEYTASPRLSEPLEPVEGLTWLRPARRRDGGGRLSAATKPMRHENCV